MPVVAQDPDPVQLKYSKELSQLNQAKCDPETIKCEEPEIWSVYAIDL